MTWVREVDMHHRGESMFKKSRLATVVMATLFWGRMP